MSFKGVQVAGEFPGTSVTHNSSNWTSRERKRWTQIVPGLNVVVTRQKQHSLSKTFFFRQELLGKHVYKERIEPNLENLFQELSN